MTTIPSERIGDPLARVADAVTRAWERYLASAEPDCEMCSDSGYLPAPLGAWRPNCPRQACASKRRPGAQANDTEWGTR